MNNLSDECYLAIFMNVDLVDLIAICRLVCKRWKYLIDEHIRFDELIIYHRYYYYYYNHSNSENDSGDFDENLKTNLLMNGWFCNYKSKVNYHRSIAMLNLHYLQSASFMQMFSNLKRLNINQAVDGKHFNVEILNQFYQLEQLSLRIMSIGKEKLLKLPKLETLSVDLMSDAVGGLNVNASNLQHLSCSGNLDMITLTHPNSIKLVRINESKRNTLNQFINCEIFQFIDCFKVDNFVNLNLSILHSLPRVNELHYYFEPLNAKNKVVKHVTLAAINRRISEIKRVLNHILKRRSITRRNNVKVYFLSIELDEVFFKNLNYNNFENNLEVQLENYDFLCDNMSYYTKIDYSITNRYFGDKLPSSFFDKFCNIQIVDARDVEQQEQQDQFSWFLSKCTNLIILTIGSCNFSQAFYNQLAYRCPSLKYLELADRQDEINYEFIYNLKGIWEIRAFFPIGFDIVLEAFKQCARLTRFHFIFNDCKASICKFSSRLYYLNCDLKNQRNKKICLNKIEFKELERWCNFMKTNLS